MRILILIFSVVALLSAIALGIGYAAGDRQVSPTTSQHLGQRNFDISRPSGSVLPPVFVILRVIHLDFGLRNFLLKMKC